MGKMQEDCRNDKFDCSEAVQLIIVDHDKGAGLTPLFSFPGFSPGEPTAWAGYFGAAFPGNICPTPTIFNESYGGLTGWKEYVSAEQNNGTAARYWTGTLTTVSN